MGATLKLLIFPTSKGPGTEFWLGPKRRGQELEQSPAHQFEVPFCGVGKASALLAELVEQTSNNTGTKCPRHGLIIQVQLLTHGGVLLLFSVSRAGAWCNQSRTKKKLVEQKERAQATGGSIEGTKALQLCGTKEAKPSAAQSSAARPEVSLNSREIEHENEASKKAAENIYGTSLLCVGIWPKKGKNPVEDPFC